LALALGAAVSLVLFMSMLGPRHDVSAAMRTVRFDLKFVDTLAFLAPTARCFAGVCCGRMRAPARWRCCSSRPSRCSAAPWSPSCAGPRRYVGDADDRQQCDALPDADPAVFDPAARRADRGHASRRAAQYPALSGALAGAAAAGVAATIYATNCTDDSPLFVASWYPLATLIVAAVGALAGRRFLQW
jgi:hypothetical protein